MASEEVAADRSGSDEEGVAPFVEPLSGPWATVTLGVLLLALVTFGVVAVALGWVSVSDVRSWVQAQGMWAPVAYLVLFVLAAVLVLPGTAMIVLAALLFPFPVALLLAWAGSVLGATAAFVLARRFGRAFVTRLLGGRLARLEGRVAARGFQLVLLLRLTGVPPYNLLNFASGLTRVRLFDYVGATVLGMLPLVVAVVAIVNRIGRAPTFLDVVTDPVLYVVLAVVVVLVVVSRRLKRRAAAVVRDGPTEGA